MTENSTVCTVMGVGLHFFTLSEFTWSSVLATDLIKTFVFTRIVHSHLGKDSRFQTFVIYSLYGWGSPFIICFIAVILDQHSDANIDYASEMICWLQPEKAHLLAFIVPIALVLMYNLLAFIVLGVSIHRAMKKGSGAQSEMTDQGKSLPRIWQELKIVIGAATVLSLSWVPAFLAAAINELKWLWYVFMVATILQGILLFTVFVLNRKVRLLYSQLYKKKILSRRASVLDGQLTRQMTKISSIQTIRSSMA